MRSNLRKTNKAIKPVLITDLLEGDSSVLDGGRPALLDLGEVQLVPWPQSVKSYNQDSDIERHSYDGLVVRKRLELICLQRKAWGHEQD